eukprot:TRINITY_DN10770_c0_g1_i4.p1 TRINITY_DN10770_c0_g1~~TRINITY_DN10770_c0_g1_i4.p1  ORF type:complete len:1202 (-),score=206.53 TRINITY_DN10770_c0_g1_i4:14-3619(-)
MWSCLAEILEAVPTEGLTPEAITAVVADLEVEFVAISAASARLKSKLDQIKKSATPHPEAKTPRPELVTATSSEPAYEPVLDHLEPIVMTEDDEPLTKNVLEQPTLPAVLCERWGTPANDKPSGKRKRSIVLGAGVGANLGSASLSTARRMVTQKKFDQVQHSTEKQKLKLNGIWEEVNQKANSGRHTYMDHLLVDQKTWTPGAAESWDHAMVMGAGRACQAIINPFSTFHIAWTLAGSLLLLSDAIMLPVLFSWDLPLSPTFTLVAITFWMADLIVNFFTGYYVRGKLVVAYRKMIKHYLSTWFFLDISMLALDVAVLVLTVTNAIDDDLSKVRGWPRMLRLFRMIRLANLSKFSAKLEVTISNVGQQSLEMVAAMLKTFCTLILAVHVLGCLWWFVGRASEEAGEATNWIRSEGYQNYSGIDQYLVCFHWVLGQFTPAPMRLQPTNVHERAYNIFVIFFALVVVGSSISRITQTIGEMLKLKAAANLKRRQVSQYLKTNKINVELTMRILLFVDHKLGKQKEVMIDRTLISERLMKELNKAKRGPLLKADPLFDLIYRAFPSVFVEICGSLKQDVHEQGDDIFTVGKLASSMYVILPGIYNIIPFGNADLQEELANESPAFFAELSLYSAFLHTSTLRSTKFTDTYTLDGVQFAECMRDTPACGTFVYQYARHLIGQVASGKCKALDILPEDVRMVSVRYTDCHQVLNMDDTRKLSKFMIFNMEQTEPLEGIQKLLDILADPKVILEPAEVEDTLRTIFPELRADTGTHATFSLPSEHLRALASMMSVLFLVTDRYEDFTRHQDGGAQLSREGWGILQQFVDWSGVRGDSKLIRTVLIFLAIKGLGKSEHLLLQVPENCQGPESMILHLLEHRLNVIPSVEALDEETQEFLKDMFMVHKEFNLGQFIQAENSPVAVLNLQLFEKDSSVKVSLFAALGLMCGIMGAAGAQAWWGSKFMNQTNSELIVLSLQALQFTSSHSSQAIFWSYIEKRGILLGLASSSPSDLALTRLACLCRIQDPYSKDLRSLQLIWAGLDNPDRQVLVDYLLADGINENGILFTYLPFCLAHAKNNKAVGMSSMLSILVELIEITRMRMNVWLDDRSERCLLVVNVQDLAAFTQTVKSTAVFESCLEHVTFKEKDDVLYLSMTESNWSHVDDADTHVFGLSSSMRRLIRKQRDAQKCLDKLQDERSSCHAHALL